MSDDIGPTLRDSGDLFMPQPVREVLEYPFFHVLGASVNSWTGIHAATGFMLGKANVDFGPALAMHEIWEQWQQIIGETPATRAGVVDKMIDTLAYTLGWLGGRN